jgi:hypothetical protein
MSPAKQLILQTLDVSLMGYPLCEIVHFPRIVSCVKKLSRPLTIHDVLDQLETVVPDAALDAAVATV